MKIFHQLHCQGNTIMIVTHERSIAEFAQRVVRFREGRIESVEGLSVNAD